ncbi:hypothetical protein LRR81_11815 [Metabacillus sp. GX 13764]|uniref:hypothetical protein n=1 Tax=Metabacillus kandeliae TaxID=2900151 RepID=UPI001E471070|nr:hypothetical protein [Metabacillus kandeliae]MCD7034934.1 hypothetical protein [Metabacillus kandeliae]
MLIFGVPIQQIYLYVIGIAGILTLFTLFFGDAISGAFDADGFSAVLIFSFFTFLGAIGFAMEQTTELNSVLILLLSALSALLLDLVLKIFVLVPLSRAEESLVYTEQSLNGRIGKVITAIPEDGYGEVLLESTSGVISKSARSLTNEGIKEGAVILVIEAEKGSLTVKEYEPLFKGEIK